MLRKIIISLVLILLTNCHCFAQSKGNSVLTAQPAQLEIRNFSEFMKELKQLNKEIDSFFVREKASNIYRNLNYIKIDLSNYLKVRKELMESLEQSNYEIRDNRTKILVSQLNKDIRALEERIEDVKPFIVTKLSSDERMARDNIGQTQQDQRTLYLNELDKLKSGEDVNKDKLRRQGRRMYNELNNSLKLIEDIQERLAQKYNIEA